MALLHVALDLIWQLWKCPESWRLEVVQEINSDNFVGVEGKGDGGWFQGEGGAFQKQNKKTCFVGDFLASIIEICFWLLD